MKEMTILTLLFLGLLTSTAQAQQSINAGGGEAEGSGGTVSFSIGQIDYMCLQGSTGTVNQGVQQIEEVTKLLTNTFDKIEMVVYPNPTTDYVNLKIENLNSNTLTFALFDLQGRRLAANKIEQDETQIQMNYLATSMYLLTVSDGDKILKTFKVIKKN